MPVHDWSMVNAGIFHDFHHSWIEEIKRALNAGLLPADYYAMAEQIAGGLGPDVLALQIDSQDGHASEDDGQGLTAVIDAPPRVQFTAETEMDQYAQKQNSLVIRHSSGDRVIALVEIVSPGNKTSRHGLHSFVEKAAAALYRGYHLLILDLHAPGPRDPEGIHGAIWEEIEDDSYHAPRDKPLTLAAYSAGSPKRAYVEPIAVGQALPEMPLFLEPDAYIKVPLDATYQAAWSSGVPLRWQRVLESRDP
jgi:hypothetical protein